MSVVYDEHRNFIHDENYPPIDDPHDPTPDDRYSDPNDPVVTALASYTSGAPSNFADHETRLDLGPPPLPKEDSPTVSNQRIKAIPKPERKVTTTVDGKFICEWPGCAEDIKIFQRKCEWNKHMDKHDRPYKCAVEGCVKLPGFTYSGGLLRHEREVHGKHGGPKKSLNCLHVNCKRHTGKGFSRLENLNEHLRRVHTQNGVVSRTETEAGEGGSETARQKRKRDDDDEDDDDDDLREEIKRVRQENGELRRQIEGHNVQTVHMMQQIKQLSEALQLPPRIAPTAPML